MRTNNRATWIPIIHLPKVNPKIKKQTKPPKPKEPTKNGQANMNNNRNIGNF